jgi:hypothetical protein
LDNIKEMIQYHQAQKCKHEKDPLPKNEQEYLRLGNPHQEKRSIGPGLHHSQSARVILIKPLNWMKGIKKNPG